MDEILRDIEGFEGLYMVSDQGNVYSVNYHRQNKFQKRKTYPEKNRYEKITLCKNSKTQIYFIHRLVAKAFPEICGEWFEGCVINHKDCNPSNNRATNLEVCTQSHNINYDSRNYKVSKALSKPVARYSLNGELLGIFLNARIAALMTGAIGQNICACCHGKLKAHHGSRWAFIDLQL